jgi:hypothetical protein
MTLFLLFILVFVLIVDLKLSNLGNPNKKVGNPNKKYGNPNKKA